jgi:hypothetical protein
MSETFFLVDTASMVVYDRSSTIDSNDAAALNAGYMHSNSSLRWLHWSQINESLKADL